MVPTLTPLSEDTITYRLTRFTEKIVNSVVQGVTEMSWLSQGLIAALLALGGLVGGWWFGQASTYLEHNAQETLTIHKALGEIRAQLNDQERRIWEIQSILRNEFTEPEAPRGR